MVLVLEVLPPILEVVIWHVEDVVGGGDDATDVRDVVAGVH